MRTKARLSRVICAVVALGASSVLAQPTKLGGEFQVNTYTSSQQRYPAVDRDSDGDFVVTWMGAVLDGNLYGVIAQRFNSAGAPQGAEFVVNSYTSSGQGRPRVALAPAGNFIVVWQSARDGGTYGIFAQRFSSAGALQGGEFQLNTYTTNNQRLPRIAMNPDGDFVVVWQSAQDGAGSYGIFGKRFSAAGVAQAAEFQVNVVTVDTQKYPAVGMEDDGDFVVAWQSNLQDGDIFGVFARRFNSAGTPLGSEFQATNHTVGDQAEAAVEIESDGDFIIAWQSGHDGSGAGIFARRFAAAGTAVASEFQVNTQTLGTQRFPALALEGDGDFVVVWEDGINDGSMGGVFGQRFSSTGAAQGPEFQVNSYVTDDQRRPSIGMTSAGAFVVAWMSDTQDGYQFGIFGQRFAGAGATIDVDGDGVVGPLTDSLLILRYTFGFRGAVLIAGAVGNNCTRCSAPDIEAYIDSLD